MARKHMQAWRANSQAWLSSNASQENIGKVTQAWRANTQAWQANKHGKQHSKRELNEQASETL